MTDKQPYADAVASLLDQGYELGDITTAAVVNDALNAWLQERIEAAIRHHDATTGHRITDRCESWHALHMALTMMLDDTHRFAYDLLDSSRIHGS